MDRGAWWVTVHGFTKSWILGHNKATKHTAHRYRYIDRYRYFGHLMQRTDPFEKTLMLGKIEGGRRG